MMSLWLVPISAEIAATRRTTLREEREARRYSMSGRGWCVEAPDAATASRAVWAANVFPLPPTVIRERGRVPVLDAAAATAAARR